MADFFSDLDDQLDGFFDDLPEDEEEDFFSDLGQDGDGSFFMVSYLMYGKVDVSTKSGPNLINEAEARRAVRCLDSPAFSEICLIKVTKDWEMTQLDISQELSGMREWICYKCKKSLKSPGHKYNKRDLEWECEQK